MRRSSPGFSEPTVCTACQKSIYRSTMGMCTNCYRKSQREKRNEYQRKYQRKYRREEECGD